MTGYQYRSRIRAADPDYLRPEHLPWLIQLGYRHIRRNEDIERGIEGAHRRGPRDDAQDFRDNLLKLLADSPASEASIFLRDLLSVPELGSAYDYIRRLLRERAEREAEGEPWEPVDVRTFTKEYEAEPRSSHALYRLVLGRLEDLKTQIETGTFSQRTEVQKDALEARLQNLVANDLKQRAKGHYDVVREPEGDYKKRPDIGIFHNALPSTSIEIKWADSWTYNQLVAALEDQLIGQYLRGNDCRHGILLMGNHDPGHLWWPDDGRELSFAELTQDLQQKALAILQNRYELSGLRVVGIDFTTDTAPKPRRAARKKAKSSIAA